MKQRPDRITWRAEVLERRFQDLRRRYPEYFAMLLRALNIRPGLRAVDVGCGSGSYARMFGAEVGHDGQVIGVDVDRALLSAGRERAIAEGNDPTVHFVQGDALHLPLTNNLADIVLCNTLLWILPEPEQAIQEMVRVAKPGGLICASEVDGGLWMRYNEDPHYLALAEKAHQAFMAGVKKLHGSDFQIGRKLPALFRCCGLVDICAYPRVFVNLACDLGNHELSEVLESYEWRLALVNRENERGRERWERTKRIQMAGGMSESECEEYRHRQRERLEKSLADPQRLLADVSLTTWGGILVTGRKP